MRLFKIMLVSVLSVFCAVVLAQTATTAKVVDFAVGGGTFSVELKGCSKSGIQNTNVMCEFIWTNKNANDFGLRNYVDKFFRAYDSVGTTVGIGLAQKGNGDWRDYFEYTFASQLPTRVRIAFKLPPEDKTVTLLDLLGDKVVRFGQIPIAEQ